MSSAQALMAAFWICAPLLVVAFVVSILINLIQIATSMQDPVFSYGAAPGRVLVRFSSAAALDAPSRGNVRGRHFRGSGAVCTLSSRSRHPH